MSEQIEAGAKAQLKRVFLTLALFASDQRLQYHDMSTPAAPLYGQDGRQLHRGLEFTATGELPPGFTIVAGDSLNTDAFASFVTCDAALRCEWRIKAHPLTLRGNVTNLTGQNDWRTTNDVGAPRTLRHAGWLSDPASALSGPRVPHRAGRFRFPPSLPARLTAAR